MRGLFYKLPANFYKSFSGKNLFLHVAAIFLTILIVKSGFDWTYYLQTHRVPGLTGILFPAAILGGLVPILSPIFLFIYGAVRTNKKLLNTAFALAQAAFLGWFVTSIYKFFTGRPGPEFRHAALTDISKVFDFGFNRGGIFFGWPSSHAAVAFATMTALILLYPKNKKIKAFALIYATYVALGVSATIHWFSDAAAGILVGIAIGLAVGRTFRKRLEIIEKS